MRLTAAIAREGDRFVAQCLEVDVASQGTSLEEARGHPGRGTAAVRRGKIARGTMRAILRQAGLSADEFEGFLR